MALLKMPRDIFPSLGIPTIYVAQPFGGMDPAQMEGYLTYYYEYHFLYITGIEHVESKSIQGNAIIKLQFYPGTDMSQAMSETVAYVNRARAFMPPGTVPPFIMRLDAGSVPVGNLVFFMSTVVIENIHTHLGRGKAVRRAVVDSGHEVALPLLIAMLCVLSVFVPSFFMVGAAKAMFLPLSLAVGFSMVASYLLSSTLVPILSVWLLRGHEAPTGGAEKEMRFAKFQKRYAGFSTRVVRFRWIVVLVYLASVGALLVLI